MQPSEAFDVLDKNAFYEQLHAIQKKLVEGTIVLVVGDLNVKVIVLYSDI